MSTDRRAVLKGLAAAGLMAVAMPWSRAASTVPMSAGLAATDAPIRSVTSLVSGSSLDASFMAGVRQALGTSPEQALSIPLLEGLDAGGYAELNRLLGDTESTLLVGLLDDASATLVLDLVRSHGGRVLSMQSHRVGADATTWARELGQALLSRSNQAPQAPVVADGRTYVSLSCVI